MAAENGYRRGLSLILMMHGKEVIDVNKQLYNLKFILNSYSNFNIVISFTIKAPWHLPLPNSFSHKGF
jgi:hypothetical protein